MNANGLTKHYDKLTPAERFPLIVAANFRHDKAEAERLATAAGWHSYRERDFVLYSDAFRDIAEGVYMELFDCALHFAEMEGHYAEAAAPDDALASNDESTDEDGADHAADDAGADADDETRERSVSDRHFDLMLASGFVLKTRLAGWKLFCERRNLPPIAVWHYLPGWERLKAYLDRVEHPTGPAFVREGMLRFMNDVSRRKGKAEVTDADMISPENLADELDRLFVWHVERCGG